MDYGLVEAANAIGDAVRGALRPTAGRWYRWGTVVAVNGDGTLDVRVGPDSVVPSVRCGRHVVADVAAGDRVRVTTQGAEAVVDLVRAARGPVEAIYESDSWTICRTGHVVMVHVHGASLRPSTTELAIPVSLEAYAPRKNASATILTSSGGSTQAARLVVYTDGSIHIVPAGYSSTASWYGTLTYIYP